MGGMASHELVFHQGFSLWLCCFVTKRQYGPQLGLSLQPGSKHQASIIKVSRYQSVLLQHKRCSQQQQALTRLR